jgi:hypothetical protein
MSVVKSSSDHLVLSSDGATKEIQLQIDGVEKASLSASGAFTATTIDATKLTGNLPAISGASLTSLTSGNLTGALPVIDGSNLTGLGGGLSEADQWRLHTGFSGASDLTTNLERNDSASFTKLGTGMTQSSGVFAFPSTGYWLVTFNVSVGIDIDNYAAFKIYYTGDNGSTWVIATTAPASSASNGHYHNIETKEIFDITDVSNQKVKFRSEANNVTNGNSTYSGTSMVFIKLGET